MKKVTVPVAPVVTVAVRVMLAPVPAEAEEVLRVVVLVAFVTVSGAEEVRELVLDP